VSHLDARQRADIQLRGAGGGHNRLRCSPRRRADVVPLRQQQLRVAAELQGRGQKIVRLITHSPNYAALVSHSVAAEQQAAEQERRGIRMQPKQAIK
jgi:hypothetical protein